MSLDWWIVTDYLAGIEVHDLDTASPVAADWKCVGESFCLKHGKAVPCPTLAVPPILRISRMKYLAHHR